MTQAEMLSRSRTFLDEASASYWSDTEVYAALADGQNAVINALLAMYKQRMKVDPNFALPYSLATLLISAGAGMTDYRVAIPSGFLWLVNAKWDHDGSGTEEPCYIVSQDRNFSFNEDNSYLQATSTEPKAYLSYDISGTALMIHFLPVNVLGGTYTINYLKTPTDIASGQAPTLPVETHKAIVYYAVAMMMFKDKHPLAQNYYQLYLSELRDLL